MVVSLASVTTTPPVGRRVGVLLCGLSAIAFALLGPFGIPAFATGASVNTVSAGAS